MSLTATFAPPATAEPARQVVIGHAADTGEAVAYTAATGQRACNGLITGGIGSSSDMTSLVHRVAEVLDHSGRWLVRLVDAGDPSAIGFALDTLDEAERVISHRRDGDPLHLVVWLGLDDLVNHRGLGRQFAARVAAVAEHGPQYGVAQLATAQTADHRVLGARNLPHLLADNAIALRAASRWDWYTLGGASVRPFNLPRAPGHAYALQPGHLGGGQAFVHIHLDGADVHGCSTCCRAIDARLTEQGPATCPVPVDVVFGWHPALQLTAWCDQHGRGVWRWRDVHPGDDRLTSRQIGELQALPRTDAR